MKRFKNILCVIEVGKPDKHVLERAVTLAENNQANLTVINMIERMASEIEILESSVASADLHAGVMRRHEQQLESLVEPYRKKIPIRTKILIGIPFLEIIREVLRCKFDLVIKITETPDWLDRIFSSDDMNLLRKCPCPIWLIKPKAPEFCRRILAAVDVDDSWPPAERKTRWRLNQKILEIASSLALSEFAALHIANAWQAVGERLIRERASFRNSSDDKITAYIEQVRKHHQHNLDILIGEVTGRLGKDAVNYIAPQVHLVRGSARKEIPALAKQIETDLIVMGTVARTGIPGFIMGNTAETILNQINCSVLAIKPHGFITPIALEN